MMGNNSFGGGSAVYSTPMLRGMQSRRSSYSNGYGRNPLSKSPISISGGMPNSGGNTGNNSSGGNRPNRPSRPNRPNGGGNGSIAGNPSLPYDTSWLMQDPEFAAFLAQYNLDYASARNSAVTSRQEARRLSQERRSVFAEDNKDALRGVNEDFEGRGMFFSGARDKERAQTTARLTNDLDRALAAYREQRRAGVRASVEDRGRLMAALIVAAQQAAQRLTEQEIETAASQQGLV